MLVLECVPRALARRDARALGADHRHRRRAGVLRAGAGDLRHARHLAGQAGALRPELHAGARQHRGGARGLCRGGEGRLVSRARALLLSARRRPDAVDRHRTPRRGSHGHRPHRRRTARAPAPAQARRVRADDGQPARRPPVADARSRAQHGDAVVASIFVNRLQFGPNEDFDRYPRTLEADCAGLERERRRRAVRAATSRRCIRRRRSIACSRRRSPTSSRARRAPGFFHGVCTVVLKLFNLVQPDVAMFGKKDRQQLQDRPRHGAAVQLADRDRSRRDGARRRRARAVVAQQLPVAGGARRGAEPVPRAARRSPTRSPAAATTTRTSRPPAARSSRIAAGRSTTSPIRHGLGVRIPHPEGFDHPNLLIVLGAARLGATRLIDNVDVIQKDGED